MIKMNSGFDMEGVFGEGGLLAKSLPAFEAREEQLVMAEAVEGAFSGGERLAVEAGTGVGKSFAYLVPAIETVSRGRGKVLVSTFTITLQEQLINKDLPFLAEALPYPFKAVLAKGRGNYLCKRRLEFAMRRAKGSFDSFIAGLDVIQEWADETGDGSLSDLGELPDSRLWDAVKSEHGNCRGRKCPFYSACFYWLARREVENADIIVANHALMFSDLALKFEGVSILGDYDFVIVDEAHNIERVAEDHFGINVSEQRIGYLLGGLYNLRTHKGLLTYSGAEKAVDLVSKVYSDSKRFFKSVGEWYDKSYGQNNGRCYPEFVDDILTEGLKQLRKELMRLAREREDEDEKYEFLRYCDRCLALIDDLVSFLGQTKKGQVYWVERSFGRRQSLRLCSAPINVGSDVKRSLMDEHVSVVMTSATLSTDGAEKGGFDFFASRVGLEDYKSVLVGSPFDYEKQVQMYVEKGMGDPNVAGFVEAAVEKLKYYIRLTGGKAFVLFTSYSMLNKVADEMEHWLEGEGLELFRQGGGVDRGVMLERFKESGGVLFGTDSFWQGVDVPGEALSNVIITKLPFAVPNHPLLAGRLEEIKEGGGNPFFEYQLPSAIIKFKQGFGRLIRTKNDNGIVVILDSRVVTRRYGRMFLESVPKCETHIVG